MKELSTVLINKIDGLNNKIDLTKAELHSRMDKLEIFFTNALEHQDMKFTAALEKQ